MSSIEFLHSFGWICVTVYCLNNLGLVPSTWVDAAQSKLGIDAPPQIEVSPTPVLSPSPSTEASPNATAQ